MSQRGLRQTKCSRMLMKLINGCYFILSQESSYFHKLCQPYYWKYTYQKGTCNKIFRRIHWWKFVLETTHDILSSKIFKSIDILYKLRDVLSQPCLKQLHFSFIHNYINHANITWGSTSKGKLERLYRCQKHAAGVIYHKDWYTHASLLLNDMKALNVFKSSIFNIVLCVNVSKI